MREDWEVKKLGDVCETSAGGTPLKSHKDYYRNGTIPWLRSGEVGQSEIFESENFITEKGLKNSSAKLFPKNSVLIAMYGATAGEVGILKIEASTNQAVCAILPSGFFTSEYLYYFFLHYKKELISKAIGNAQPNLSQKKIKNTHIPVPPLPEQKQIVAILDEAFAALDRAKANIEQNIANAEELFQSKLNEIFSQRGEGWEEKEIKNVSKTASNIKWEKTEGERDYIDLSSVSRVSLTITETEKVNRDNAPSRAKKIVEEGDVIFGTTRPTLKRAAIIHSEFSNQICSTGFYVIRPDNEIITSKWVFLFLQTKSFMDRMERIQSGASYPAVNYTDMKNSIIRYPSSTDEQKKLSSYLFELQKEKSMLIEIFKLKLTKLEELKKSILQQAFSGALTGESGEAALADVQDAAVNKAAEAGEEYEAE